MVETLPITEVPRNGMMYLDLRENPVFKSGFTHLWVLSQDFLPQMAKFKISELVGETKWMWYFLPDGSRHAQLILAFEDVDDLVTVKLALSEAELGKQLPNVDYQA